MEYEKKNYFCYAGGGSCIEIDRLQQANHPLPNGTVIEGKVESWKDFNDGDQIQCKI